MICCRIGIFESFQEIFFDFWKGGGGVHRWSMDLPILLNQCQGSVLMTVCARGDFKRGICPDSTIPTPFHTTGIWRLSTPGFAVSDPLSFPELWCILRIGGHWVATKCLTIIYSPGHINIKEWLQKTLNTRRFQLHWYLSYKLLYIEVLICVWYFVYQWKNRYYHGHVRLFFLDVLFPILMAPLHYLSEHKKSQGTKKVQVKSNANICCPIVLASHIQSQLSRLYGKSAEQPPQQKKMQVGPILGISTLLATRVLVSLGCVPFKATVFAGIQPQCRRQRHDNPDRVAVNVRMWCDHQWGWDSGSTTAPSIGECMIETFKVHL